VEGNWSIHKKERVISKRKEVSREIIRWKGPGEKIGKGEGKTFQEDPISGRREPCQFLGLNVSRKRGPSQITVWGKRRRGVKHPT